MVLRGWIERRLGVRTKRHGGAKRKAKKQLATIAYVRKAINSTSEKKFIQSQNVSIGPVVTATPVLQLLNGLQQGTTDNTRTGDRVRYTKLLLHAYLVCPLQVSGTASHVKVDIIKVKNPRGVAPTVLQIYGSATPGAGDFFNHNTVDFSSRFQILDSKEYQFNLPSVGNAEGYLMKFDIDLNDMQTDYSIGNAGTIADIDANALYVLYHQDNSTSIAIYQSAYLYYMDM